MSSLRKGDATSFREILHPQAKLTQVATGQLDDGRGFQVEVSAIVRQADDQLRHVRIEFR